MVLDEVFLSYSAGKLRQYAGRIEDCLARLSDEQIWARNTENENAIGNLVLHLCGNLRQWIAAGVAGRPDDRQRDAEFSERGAEGREALGARLRATVDDTLAIFDDLDSDKLGERRRIQGYDITVLEAVYHVVEHFSAHTGQILFATKLLTGADLGYYRHLSRPDHSESTP